MDHLAIPVSDQARSRRFYETYFGFGARPAEALRRWRPDALRRHRLRPRAGPEHGAHRQAVLDALRSGPSES
ncbi:MAG: VOC family protein [Solirubrobacteraceae bacterium]